MKLDPVTGTDDLDAGRVPVSLGGDPVDAIRKALGQRTIVLVGLMGAGKSTIGRRLALRLGLPFVDVDTEIEQAAGMSIADIFEVHGEAAFRDGEKRVIARLLGEGARIMATGGGAFMNPETRARVAEAGVSVWLKADLDVLMRRVRKRDNRPLLRNPDPEGVLKRLMDERYPVYAQADITILSVEGPHEHVVDDIVAALHTHLTGRPAGENAAEQTSQP